MTKCRFKIVNVAVNLLRHSSYNYQVSTDHGVELSGVEDLSPRQESEAAKLPHDVLTDTVSQAGVTLGVTGQSEDVLQHGGQQVPGDERVIMFMDWI